jgi:cytochrome c-type biogenesis protein CcmF
MLLSAVMLGLYWKKIPNPQKEEQLSSREFWMFIGALVLTISAIQITFTTSIPVWNKFFHLFRKLPAIGQFFTKDLAPPVNPVQHYNSVQVWIAIMLTIGSGYVQYLRYKHSNIKEFFINIAPSALAAVIFSVPAAIMLEITLPHYMLMFVACMFAIIANTQYVIVSLKGKLKSAGASVAHVGFGLLLLGALISQHNQEVISVNTSGIDFGDSFDNKSKMENILLRRDEPVKMGDYDVTYIGDSVAPPNHYYKVRYKRFDEEGNLKEEFTLLPNAQINKNMGLVSSPDTRHYLTKDIYTHVTSVPNKEKIEQELTKYVPDTIAVGDTFYTAKAFVIAERLIPDIGVPGWEKTEKDISVGLRLRAHTLDDQTYHATPVYLIRNNMPFSIADSIPELGIAFRIEKILPEKGLIVLGKKEKDFENDFIIMKAIVFPYINLLWLGCIVMLTGFVISMRRRISENK